NRGECAQICRLPYTLSDSKGNIICKDKHLLSLKDLNTIDILPSIIEAGISSFKIEGRLKEAAYVKNTVAAYRQAIDRFISENPDDFRRSSVGTADITFSPELSKSFNRGFSHYFIDSRRPKTLISPDTPKSLGEIVKDIKLLNNGDGISFFDSDGRYTGAMVNGIQGKHILTSKPVNIPKGSEIHRTFDRVWDKEMKRETATRKIDVSFVIDDSGLTAIDERGCKIRIQLDCKKDVARKTPDYSPIFTKLGNTFYRLKQFSSYLDPSVFIPAADLTELRRKAIDTLDKTNLMVYPFKYRKKENLSVKYFTDKLDYRDNVANSLTEKFYREHGVNEIKPALETSIYKHTNKKQRLMTTRHCILRELGLCKKEKGLGRYSEPLSLNSGKNSFFLEFNCHDCEMHLMG
ncbi:MAG: U32 family peptidase, partial [Muribaculaceae bacterium]|nr:U32 family peptidase [Muribaculaceae bacterium]